MAKVAFFSVEEKRTEGTMPECAVSPVWVTQCNAQMRILPSWQKKIPCGTNCAQAHTLLALSLFACSVHVYCHSILFILFLLIRHIVRLAGVNVYCVCTAVCRWSPCYPCSHLYWCLCNERWCIHPMVYMYMPWPVCHCVSNGFWFFGCCSRANCLSKLCLSAGFPPPAFWKHIDSASLALERHPVVWSRCRWW